MKYRNDLHRLMSQPESWFKPQQPTNMKAGIPIRLEAYCTAVYTLECHFCGKTLTSNPGLDVRGVAMLTMRAAEIGWREIKSKSCQVVAAACPECVKMQDKYRGLVSP